MMAMGIAAGAAVLRARRPAGRRVGCRAALHTSPTTGDGRGGGNARAATRTTLSAAGGPFLDPVKFKIGGRDTRRGRPGACAMRKGPGQTLRRRRRRRQRRRTIAPPFFVVHVRAPRARLRPI